MVMPAATGHSLDILLKFQMDAAANERVKSGISTLEEELKKLEGAFPGEQIAKQANKVNEALKETEQQAKSWTQFLKEHMGPEMKAAMQAGADHAEAHKVAIAKIAEAWKQYKAEGVTALKTVQSEEDKAARTAQDRIRQAQAEANLLRKQVADMLSDQTRAQISALREVSNTIGGISRTALLLGGGILGGAFALANNYVQDAEQATAVTVQWKAATESLKKSQAQIGAVLAEQALPLLERAAALAAKASDFIEANPEIVRAALNTGLVLTSLGIVGTLVSKGIKLVADVKYLATIPTQLEAARLQDLAATKQLEAAQLRLKEIGGNIPGPAGKAPSLLSLGPLAAILSGAALFSAIGRGASNVGARAFGFESPEDFWKKMLSQLGLVKTAADGAAASLGKVAGETASFSFGARGSPQFQEVLQAYEQYRQDDLEAVQKHYADRQEIIANALAAEQKANADYAASVAKIRAQTTRDLADAAAQFAEANQKAEIDYQQQRAQIIRDGNQEIERLQEQLQERLRKSREQHEERVADLTASRDALGLAKERQRFTQEQAEIQREGSQEIRQRRAEIAQRLADLAQSYEQERAQRLADYQARVAEIQANAAQRLAELQKEHAEELRQIQLQKIAKIRELDAQFVEERKRRYQYFIQQIRDLDASLLGEKRLREKYQASMIQDLDKFLAAYRAKLGTLASAAPGRQEGGYTSGLVRTGEGGYEYVLSHNTTRAAEAMIGGRLTQQGLLAALAGMGGGRSVVWNDVRRFDGAYTNAMREMVRKDTQETIERMLR